MAEYLYCIINRTKLNGFPEEGIEGGRPYALPYQDLCAIVSEAPLKDYEPDDDNIARHKDVELAVMKDHTVLPVAFGMVFKTKGVIVNTMRNVYPILKRSLRLIDNKIELGVKVITPKEGKDVKEDIPLDTGVPQEITQAITEEEGTDKEKEDFAALDTSAPKEGKDVKEDIPLDTGVPQEITQDVKEEVSQEATHTIKEEDFTTLDKIAVESRKGEMFSDRLLYNKSFLIDRKDIERFSEEVEKIRQKYKECKIKYSGPWPPYNFVDIRIMGRGR